MAITALAVLLLGVIALHISYVNGAIQRNSLKKMYRFLNWFYKLTMINGHRVYVEWLKI